MSKKPQIRTKPPGGPVLPGKRMLQRKCACGASTSEDQCEDCKKKKSLQRKALGTGRSLAAPPIVHEVLSSPGKPLDAGARNFLEPRFGHDFSKVRVHTDDKAAASAEAVNALAYTVGANVVFARGQYSPQTAPGRHILAHELTHVVQQQSSSGSAASGLRIEPTGGPLETQADAAAQVVMAGEPLGVALNAPGPRLQRQPAGGGQPLVLSLPRKELKDKGNADINEIIDALPARLFNGQKVVIKRATANNVQHVFELGITITPGEPPATSGEAAITRDLTAASPAPGGPVMHPISLTIFQKISDPQMTLFHELIHVRLIMDRYLPPDQQSDTYSRFSQRLEMASDPALLAVTGAGPLRQAVFDGFVKIRNWYKTFVPGFKVPPNLDQGGDEERYRTLINEYFTNKEAQRAFNKTESNTRLAGRYKSTFRADLQVAAQDQGLFQALLQARERAKSSASLSSDFDLSDQLASALASLFDALDQQLRQIEQFKTEPLSPGPSGPTVLGPPPVGIDGKPVKP